MKILLIASCLWMIAGTVLADSNPLNPSQDKPAHIYVASYRLGTEDASVRTDQETDAFHVHAKDDYHYDWHWTEGQGGQGNYTYLDYLDSTGDFDNKLEVVAYSWPSNSAVGSSYFHEEYEWPDGVWDYLDFTNNAFPLPNIPWEYCQASIFYQSGGNTFYAGTRQAQTQIKLETGGKALSKRKNLFQLIVSATAQAYNVQDYFHDPFFTQPAPDPVAIEDVEVLSQHPDTNGVLYAILPDNDSRDVTPDVPDNDYYTFNVQPQKYHCYFEVLVDQPTPGIQKDYDYKGGHAFFRFYSSIPDEVFLHDYPELLPFKNHNWGFYPHGDAYWGTENGRLMSDDGHAESVSRNFYIGYPDLIAGLTYIKKLNDTPPLYSLADGRLGTSCVFAAIVAGAWANITLPHDWLPQNFGADILLQFPGPMDDYTPRYSQ